ncbi:MAG: hypothetical protein INR72_17195 [Williamsia herbipolensis]|nr:hypothetical protein [Williamsia herbipolensis]
MPKPSPTVQWIPSTVHQIPSNGQFWRTAGIECPLGGLFPHARRAFSARSTGFSAQ